MMFAKKTFLFSCIFVLINSGAKAATDYANPSPDYEGEYKSTHNDISTVGVPEKEPTLDQAEKIRERNLEEEVKPKVDPPADLDLSKPEDKELMNKIENGTTL